MRQDPDQPGPGLDLLVFDDIADAGIEMGFQPVEEIVQRILATAFPEPEIQLPVLQRLQHILDLLLRPAGVEETTDQGGDGHRRQYNRDYRNRLHYIPYFLSLL